MDPTALHEGSKRRRRRSKKKVEEVQVEDTRQNKKIKFDEEESTSVGGDDLLQNGEQDKKHKDKPEHEHEHEHERGQVQEEAVNIPQKKKKAFTDTSESSSEPALPSNNTIVKGKKRKLIKFTEQQPDSDSENENDYTFQHKSDLLKVRQKLPIYQHQDRIIETILNNQVTIVIGETGSGKSTQIPQFLIPHSRSIAVTQPRRVAAASLAARVSDEYGCKLGSEVGYQVRFTNKSSHKTKLKYLTDGMLLREIMLDRELKKYDVVVLDEAHERTILTDLIMGFLKSLIKERTDLKVVVMSATLNAELFSKFFAAPILYIEGKMYPVTQLYVEGDTEDIVDCMIRSVIKVNLTEPEGDVLCFLPGQEEIDNCVKTLEELAPQLPREAPLLVPLPLYAALSPNQQLKVFESLPMGRRKIILATNIAETSITVPGVKFVIDSGLRKVKVWKHNLGLSTLLTTPISQASARQRAGRAGRECPGKVYRLYGEDEYLELPKQQESEIKRNDIVLPILTLKKLGVDDLLNWTWLEDPGQEAILSALNTLYTLGALNDAGKITSLGVKMSTLPLPPQLSVVLITAAELGCLSAVIDIVSCLSVDNLILNVTGEARDEINFKRRAYCPKGSTHGDLISLYEFYQSYQSLGKEWCEELKFNYKGFKNVDKVKKQLQQYMSDIAKIDLKQDSKLDVNVNVDFDFDFDSDLQHPKSLDIPLVLKSFLKGYITNTAVGMPDRSYRTFNSGQLISIHPSSVLFGKPLDAIMYIEYVFTSKGYARNCSAIDLSWIQEVAPHLMGGKVSLNE